METGHFTEELLSILIDNSRRSAGRAGMYADIVIPNRL